MFTTIIVKDFNLCLNNDTFPESFKISEVIPVYKRHKTIDRNNCRPISNFLNF